MVVKGRFAYAFVGLLFVAFLLLDAMLITDKNLQTDFGAVSPYFIHWYGVLALAIGTLVLAITIIVTAGRSALKGDRPKLARYSLTVGTAWCWLAVAAMVGVLATYKQVGAASVNQFAQYLFGLTTFPGVQAYIPGLYDVVLAVFVLSGIVGAIAVLQNRETTASTHPA